MVIYKLTNMKKNKAYIGQTLDFEIRLRGHKSTAYNKRDHSYNLPLYCAIRKYGWECFKKEILEEKENSSADQETLSMWANEREQYYIEFFETTNCSKGYNISKGGGQSPKGKLTLEERAALSKIFSLEEILNIQDMLQAGTPKKQIIDKYSPRLKESFLDNINQGANFYNEKLKYPLHDYFHDISSRLFTEEDQKEIKKEIRQGIFYKEITKKWGISPGMISLINNGSVWKEKNENYPLNIKGSSRIHNWNIWVQKVIFDLENSCLTLKEIQQKYNKSYSTIKKINEGASYRNPEKQYPLTRNRKK